MTTTKLATHGLLPLMDTFGVETVDEGVAELLRVFHEDGDGLVAGTVVKIVDDMDYRELARVTTVQPHGDCDATVEVEGDTKLKGWWRVTYVMGEDGRYDHTRVVRLG